MREVSLDESKKTLPTGEETSVGNYFVSNYPPFSSWRRDRVHLASERLDAPPGEDVPLGLYIHIPFCRKRCDFCYFRVYTDNDAARVHRYIDAASRTIIAMAHSISGLRSWIVVTSDNTCGKMIT